MHRRQTPIYYLSNYLMFVLVSDCDGSGGLTLQMGLNLHSDNSCLHFTTVAAHLEVSDHREPVQSETYSRSLTKYMGLPMTAPTTPATEPANVLLIVLTRPFVWM